jgi:DNA relaxase NicK
VNNQYDVNIDYLTITSNHTEDIAGFVASFQRAVPLEAGGRPFRWRGYTGEVYVADEGHLAWGVKPGHGLCQMSGEWSDKVFRNLDQFRLADYRCTRLDLAVTCAIPTPRQLVREAMAVEGLAGGNYTAITKHNGEGGTLYVGCRKSDSFGRLYDKGAEIRSRLAKETIPNAILWRYEVEYKRSLAQAMLATLRQPGSGLLKLDESIVSIVHDWFLARKVAPVFTPGERASSVVSIASRVTNIQKTLDWYRVQVRPSLMRAATHVSVDTLLEALGVEVHGYAGFRLDRPVVTPYQHGLWDEADEPL